MRYDKAVYFQHKTKGEYNGNTGDYGEPTIAEVKKYASVMDSGVETHNLVYGEIRQGVKIVQLQTHYTEPFDRIRIGSKVYRVDMSRPLRNKHIFVVSEVQ